MSIAPETVLSMLEKSFTTCDGHEECDNPDHDYDWEFGDADLGEYVDIEIRYQCLNCEGTWSATQTYSFSTSEINDS